MSGGLRRLHRAVSLLFLLAVLVNVAALPIGPAPPWLTYAPLPPLALLMLSGLVLLVQPHLVRRRTGDGAST